MAESSIIIRGAREHNLRDVDLTVPRDQLVVFTGLSGSGKSSLAFDTIYAEGQRRYVESLSSYARQFLGQMDKPDVDFIEGLSPAISIDQKSASRNPRSTVGTITEIYDYLRLLYARIGIQHDPETGEVIKRQTPQEFVDRVLELPEGTRFQVIAPVVRGRKGDYHSLLAELAGDGFARARVDGEIVELVEPRRHRRDVDRRRPPGALRAAHHRGDRRPARPARRHRASAHRLGRDRAAAGRGRLHRRAGRQGGRARGRPAHPQPARRGARAPQLLVQLAVRRVRALRRARHALRGRSRAGRAPTTTSRSTTARSRRGRASGASTSTGCSPRSPRSTASRRPRRGRS